MEIAPRIAFASYVAEARRSIGIALFLAWRDILVRFKQTLIGVVWVVARPLLTALVFAFVFGRIAGLSSGEVPYVLFVLVAVLPWQFVAASVSQGAESLVSNAGMISKIYFPRILLPVANIVSNLLDLLISLPFVAVLLLWYGIVPRASALAMVPFWLLVLVTLCFGVSTLLAAVNAIYRDVRYVVPFLILFALYISPIGYGVENVPEAWRGIYSLNPLVGLFDSLRSELLGLPRTTPAWAPFWSVAVAAGSAAAALVVFWRAERHIIDVI